MNYLFRFYFFDPAKTGVKRDLYLSSSCVDFFTNYKQQGTVTEGTRLQTNLPVFPGDERKTEEKTGFISHVVDGLPENCNQIAFDGLFFKTTVQYLSDGGAMKKYTSWLNPNNICSIYSLLPGCTECFFFSGTRILLANKLPDIVTALKTHQQKYKERKNMKYGNQKK
jgi:hypothetical protein